MPAGPTALRTYLRRARTATTTEWYAENPILSLNELGYNAELASFKIGDGVTRWLELPCPSATLSHSVTQPDDHTLSGASAAVSGGTPSGTVSAPTFTGSPTSVVQPSFTVYVWKRTA